VDEQFVAEIRETVERRLIELGHPLERLTEAEVREEFDRRPEDGQPWLHYELEVAGERCLYGVLPVAGDDDEVRLGQQSAEDDFVRLRGEGRLIVVNNVIVAPRGVLVTYVLAHDGVDQNDAELEEAMSNFLSSVWDPATVRPLILPRQEG
jgi:hypothetical protein